MNPVVNVYYSADDPCFRCPKCGEGLSVPQLYLDRAVASLPEVCYMPMECCASILLLTGTGPRSMTPEEIVKMRSDPRAAALREIQGNHEWALNERRLKGIKGRGG